MCIIDANKYRYLTKHGHLILNYVAKKSVYWFDETTSRASEIIPLVSSRRT